MNKCIIYFTIFLFFLAPTVFGDVFSLAPSSKELNLVSGEFSTFPITINNLKNETIKFNVTGDGNATKFLFFDSSVEMTPNSSLGFRVGYFISPFTSPKTYKMNITFNSTKFPVAINVKDEIDPEIGDCIITPLIQNRTQKLTIRCQGISDNLDIKSVKMNAKKGTETVSVALNKEAFGIYGNEFVINNIGNWNVSVDVTDTSDNKISKNIGNITIVEYVPINVIQKVDFQMIKFDDFHKRTFATLVAPANISFFVEYFNYTDNVLDKIISQNISLRWINAKIEVGGESRKIEVNKTIEFKNVPAGNIKIVVDGINQGEFEGRIRTTVLGKEFTTDVVGEVAFFSIPEQETWMLFGREQSCVGEYYGTYENSSLSCLLKFPIDQCSDVSDEECVLAAPKPILTDYEELQKENIGLRAIANHRGNVNLILTIGLIIIGVLFILYFIRQRWNN